MNGWEMVFKLLDHPKVSTMLFVFFSVAYILPFVTMGYTAYRLENAIMVLGDKLENACYLLDRGRVSVSKPDNSND